MASLDITNRGLFLIEHPGWALDGETIRRNFSFADFNAAIGFVTRVALLAEKADHHPDIDIRWNQVIIALTSHDVGQLTTRDTELAAAIDDLERTAGVIEQA